MRVEANISVSKTDTFGTKVEVKNLNSFKSVEAAIDYEIARHIQVLESGGTILQETRGFNEDKGETFSQRLKEGSADYRYFPEPDLPKLYISKIPEWSVEALRASLPELPAQKRARYESLALSPEAISYISASNTRSDFFDAVITAEDSKETVQLCANYFVSDLAGFYAKNGGIEFEKITPKEFRALIEMVQKGDLSSRGAKDVLTELAQNGGGASETAQALGVIQNNDAGFAQEIVAKVTQNNPAVVAEYKGGKESSLMFLVGQAMKESKGKGNPAMLKEALQQMLTS